MENNLTKKERRELKRAGKESELGKARQKSLLKKVVLWSSAAVLLGGGVFGAIKLASSVPAETSSILASAVSPTDWTKGNSSSKVILVEYSDFQCPACAAYYPMLKEFNKNFGDKIQFVYRHFPLPSHKNSRPASYAAEAAGKQGKFWEIHDLIFENQQSWSGKSNPEENFTAYAKTLGLGMDKFQADVNSKEVKEKVDNDYQSGLQSVVTYTPTFFLNGEKIQNPRNYDEFKALIEKTLGSNL